MPTDPRGIKGFLEELSRQPASIDLRQVFTLLQAGSVGGKTIWIADDRWRNTTFRSYWEPTATSSGRFACKPDDADAGERCSTARSERWTPCAVWWDSADVYSVEHMIEPGSFVTTSTRLRRNYHLRARARRSADRPAPCCRCCVLLGGRATR